ncbi:MAG: sugar phosphate isomerase/epimerase family protein [Bacteroidales bacterium]
MKHIKKISTQLVIAAVAVFFLSSLSSCAPESQEKEIGIQLYSLRDAMGDAPKETVKKVGDIGYTFVEPAGYGDGKFYGMEPAEFKKVVNNAGMDIISSHTGRPLPDDEDWDEIMEWWDECIQAHKAVGAEYIVQPSMGEKAYESLEGLQDYCEYFNTVGEKCREAGIKFGYHNHDQEFTTELEENTVYDYMIQNTDPENVFFQIDLYWAVEGGADPVDYFEKYPERFTLWHVKDKAELGASGMMDFEKYFQQAEQSGMQYHIVEIEEYNFEPIVSVEKCYDFLIDADYVEASYSE